MKIIIDILIKIVKRNTCSIHFSKKKNLKEKNKEILFKNIF